MIAITGGAGAIGNLVRHQLAEEGQPVVSIDRVEHDPIHDRETTLVVDIRDPMRIQHALTGAIAVVHLGAIPSEAPFAEILEHNIVGTYNVFEAARIQQVRRVIFASSHHVVGFYAIDEPVSVSDPLRPDSYYAVSKAFGEALGRMYHDKWGIEVICLRIGAFQSVPLSARHLSVWLSPADTRSLFSAALDAEDPGFSVVFGISNNSRPFHSSHAEARALGFKPQDDAEAHAEEVEQPDEDSAVGNYKGGPFTERARSTFRDNSTDVSLGPGDRRKDRG